MNDLRPPLLFWAAFGAALLSPLGEALAQDVPSAVVVDSARAELERGRAWHAVALMDALPSDGLSPSELLLRAEAEAGWHNDRGVVAALRGRSWLAEMGEARGLFLLGMAEARLGDDEEAERLLRVYESLAEDARRADLARSRLARIQAEAGRFNAALQTLDRMAVDRSELLAWTALEVARSASRAPAPEVFAALGSHLSGEAAVRSWALEPEALVRAERQDEAADVYAARLGSLESTSRRAWAHMARGELLAEAGDEAGARAAFEASLELFGQGTSGARASVGLLELGITRAAQARQAARILSRSGDARRSVQAYELYFDLSDEEPSVSDRFDWARQLSRLDRHEDAIVAFRDLSERADDDLELRILDTWIDVRRAQGRRDAVRTIQGWILERFPESSQAAEIHFFRGDDLQDRGALTDASVHYERALATGPHTLAGLSWMRAGQIAFGQGRYAESEEIYQRYRDAYPDGRRWDEATYWSARSAAAAGDSARAIDLFESVIARYRTSYYSVLSAIELGREFRVDVPASEVPAGASPEVVDGLATLDLFAEADLGDAAVWWVARLRERTEAVSDRMALAEALIERGYTVEGIRMGQALLSGGQTLDRRLLKIIYPFPFRDVILAEASERGLDPFLIAGLIRQESAFDRDIVSRAGAIGLMQVMPATGAQLARAERISGFSAKSLETAEINVHLGSEFWTDMARAFEGTHLPLLLSAYNAGPTRARRWRNLPEFDDPLRFTERIPFQETRGYVKNVSRNAALYRALYAEELALATDASGNRP